MSKFREIQSVTIKRCHISPLATDKYGHWWIEVGDPLDASSESYGWWPASAVGVVQTFTGVPGELNATNRNATPFRDPTSGIAIRDPHHGDPGDESFHPLVAVDDTRSEDQILECIRTYSMNYKGRWQWIFEGGQNCHTFQLALMRHCKLYEPPDYRSRILRVKY